MTTEINKSCKFSIGDSVKCFDVFNYGKTGVITEISVTKDTKFVNVHYCVKLSTSDKYFKFKDVFVHESAIKKHDELSIEEITDADRKDFMIMLIEEREQLQRKLDKTNKLITEILMERSWT